MEKEAIRIAADPIDAEVFGAPVTRIDAAWEYDTNEFSQVLRDHENKKDVFCTVPFRAEKTWALESWHYHCVGSKIFYQWDYKSWERWYKAWGDYSLAQGYRYDDARTDWADVWKPEWTKWFADDFAKTSYYWYDKDIANATTYAFYERWVDTTFKGYADQIFTVWADDQVVAFLSLKKKAEGYYVDLVSVKKEHRRKGIADYLFWKARYWAWEQKQDLWAYAQAENISVNRLYQKNGFLQQGLFLEYHKNKES